MSFMTQKLIFVSFMTQKLIFVSFMMLQKYFYEFYDANDGVCDDDWLVFS